MFEPITTRQLIENPKVKLVYTDPTTGEEIEEQFNLQKFIQRYTSLYEQYMHHGKYSVIGKFCDRLIWTFQIKTACTDGIRMFVNPLFARSLEKNRESTVMDEVKELMKKGKNWKDPSSGFDVKFEAAKYFFFIVMHECYHMIYRHVEQSKRKPETANGGEYIHWLANTSMDIEINRDIEKQWPEFQGTTEAIDGWFKPEYGNKVWTVIFDERYAAGEQMPDNSQPVIPTQRLNPPGGGGQQPQNGNDNKREYQAAQDYVDGWTKALEDYKAGKLDPRNFNPLPVDKSKFSHQVLGFLNMAQTTSPAPAANGFNQDEYNQGYNDAVIAIINAMNAQGGGGGGDVKITNLPQPPSFGGGGDSQGDSQDNQQQQNQQNQNGGGGAANSTQQIDKMNGQQAANSAQQSANNAQQSANQAQKAADAAQQKANQSGSSADQKAANQAQQAADAAQAAANAAQKAADAAKDAAGKGNDDLARDKAKEAANAANQAQQSANQANQGSNGGKQNKPITNSKDLGDNKSNGGGAADSSQQIDKMNGQQAANSAQQSANNAQQSANQAQQAASSAKQKASQSGSKTDQQAANSAQQSANDAQSAADAAQKAANAAKDAASNGNDEQARAKAKEAANAANQAQQAAGQASQQAGQSGQQSGQNGQQGQNQNSQQQNGQQQQSQNSQQSGEQSGDTQGQNGDVPTYKVTGGHKWKDQGGDLISTEEGCKIMEGEGEDVSREINKTPEDHIKRKMAELGKKLQEVGKNAGKGYTMGERLAEIAKSLEAPKIKWRRLLLRHFKNLGTKPEEEYKRKLSRSEDDRADWNEKIVPYKVEMETRNSADIFYLVDASGSISDTDLQIVFRELIGLEIKEDLDIRKSAFVYFSDNFDESRIRVWYKETDDKEKMRMVKYVSGKDAAGGTDISGSIVHVTQLKKSKNRAMRDLYSRTDPMTLIIVFTDGCEGGSFEKVGALPRSIRDKIVFVILNTESEGWGFNTVVPQIIQSAKVAPKNIVCIDTQKDLVR